MRTEEADHQPHLHHRADHQLHLHHQRPPASPPPPIRRPHQRRKSLEPSTDAITYYQGKHVAIPRHHNLERNTSWFSPLLILLWIRCSYFCCNLTLFFCSLVLWIICSMLLDCLCSKPREAYGFFVLVLPLWFCYVKLMDYVLSLDATLIWMFLLWIAEVLTRDMLEDL